MFSFGPLAYAEHLSRYYTETTGSWRSWNDFKLNAYYYFLHVSISRIALAFICVMGGISEELYRKLDSYCYYTSVYLFEHNSHMVLSMVFLTVYRLLLFKTFRYSFPEYGQRIIFQEYVTIRGAIKAEGVKYLPWQKSNKFDEIASVVSMRFMPLMGAVDRVKLVGLIYKMNFYVTPFILGLFLQSVFSVLVFYTDFVRPLQMSILWDIEYCIDVSLTLRTTFDVIRQSTFLACYAMYIITKFILQMRCVTFKLDSQLSRKSIITWELRQAVYKCHFVHVLVLLANIEMNKRIVQGFYSRTVIINLICNVSISGFFTHGYRPVMSTPLKAIVVIQIVLISLVAHFFIASSTALVRPSRAIFGSMIAFRKLNCRELQLHTRLMCFYEMIHHRRNFKFDFGPMGKISKKSLFSFWGFYFAAILMIIKNFIKEQIKKSYL